MAGFVFWAGLPAQSIMAQKKETGAWQVVIAEWRVAPKWKVFGESQLRSFGLYSRYYMHDVRGGVQYELAKNASLLVGAGKFVSYSGDGNFEPPIRSNEIRFWEQLTLDHSYGRLRLEHRYRLEQRFVNGNYRNRLRYRLGATIPVNHPKVVANTFFVQVSSEINLSDHKPYFDRNRAFAGVGYRFNPHVLVNAGWLPQTDISTNLSASTYHYFQTGLIVSIGPSK